MAGDSGDLGRARAHRRRPGRASVLCSLVDGARAMRSFRNSGLAGVSAIPVRTWRRRPAGLALGVIVAVAGMGLATVFAATAAAMPPPIPPPAPGLEPGAAVEPGLAAEPGLGVDLYYTAADGGGWLKQGVGSGGRPP